MNSRIKSLEAEITRLQEHISHLTWKTANTGQIEHTHCRFCGEFYPRHKVNCITQKVEGD